VREAADLLVTREPRTRGRGLETIHDHLAAANAYSAGGLVERMEAALAKDDAAVHAVHEETDAFAGYQTAMRSAGATRRATSSCVRSAPPAAPPRSTAAARSARHRDAHRRQGLLRRRGKP